MKILTFKSLTLRIWFYFSTMVIIAMALFMAVNLLFFTRLESENIFRNLHLYQDIILDNFTDDHTIRRWENAPTQLHRSENFREMHFLLVENNHNRLNILQDPNRPDHGKRPWPSPEFIGWLASHITKVTSKMEYNETFHQRQYFFLIKKVPEPETNLYIITYVQQPDQSHRLKEMIYPSLLIILLSLIVAKLLSGNLSKPLKELELYTKHIAKKEWMEPLTTDRQDEIGRLIQSVNQMQKSLKIADEEERAFLQSISHDLKTPVMVIKSYAEAILDGVYLNNLEETAKIISQESSKLERKIRQLIYFNSLNYIMDNQKNVTEIRLNLLFKELYERFKLIRNDLQWKFDLNEISFTCNPEQISVAFENIIDNQIRYAETTIMISLHQDNQRIRIEIYNDGPQIIEADLSKIFNRFYKEKKGNFGLGLAISQKIIAFFHGTIQAVNRDKGVSFIIQLPINSK